MAKFKGTLIIGKWYELKYTKEFSHCVGKDGFKDFSDFRNSEDRINAMFVGTAPTGIEGSFRNIFFTKDRDRRYISFGTDRLSYVVCVID